MSEDITDQKSQFITVLVAEDNDVSREMMMAVLGAQGFQTVGAIDGFSAIDALNDNDIDAAVVDINMTPAGGFEFVRHLVARGNDLPVIVVTSDDSSDMLMEANGLGVRRVLQKPVEPRRLIDTVKRVLKQKGFNPDALSVTAHDTRFSSEQLMARAIELAELNATTKKGGPFAAVVADQNGQILGEGRAAPTVRFDPTGHAEVVAIRHAAEKLNTDDLGSCTLYCSSEPTMMGKALIASVGITKVFYGLSHADIGEVKRGENRSEPYYQQMERDKALTMFTSVKRD